MVLTRYGIEVCPFFDQIDVYELIVGMSIGLGLVYLSKFGICCFLPPVDGVDLDWSWRFLMIELVTWIGTTVWNVSIYDFPLESGFKVAVGTTTLGIFSATFLAFDIERDTIVRISVVQEPQALDTSKVLSILRSSTACPTTSIL